MACGFIPILPFAGPFFKFLFQFCGVRLSSAGPGGQVVEQSCPDVEKDTTNKKLEMFRVREIFDPEDRADKYSGQCSRDNDTCERPGHSPFPDVPVDTSRDPDNVIHKIGRTDRWARKVKHAHLKWEQ